MLDTSKGLAATALGVAVIAKDQKDEMTISKVQKDMPASRIELEIFALLYDTSATRYHCAMSGNR
jgi:hypothetical protein